MPPSAPEYGGVRQNTAVCSRLASECARVSAPETGGVRRTHIRVCQSVPESGGMQRSAPESGGMQRSAPECTRLWQRATDLHQSAPESSSIRQTPPDSLVDQVQQRPAESGSARW